MFPAGCPTTFSRASIRLRAYQLFFLVPCLGALLVPLIWLLLKRNKLKEAEGPQNGVLWGLVWSSVLCFVVQFLVMMAPHFVYHYPYFVIFAWHVVAVVAVVKLRVLLLQLAALLNYLGFIIYWIVLVTIKVPVATIPGSHVRVCYSAGRFCVRSQGTLCCDQSKAVRRSRTVFLTGPARRHHQLGLILSKKRVDWQRKLRSGKTAGVCGLGGDFVAHRQLHRGLLGE